MQQLVRKLARRPVNWARKLTRRRVAGAMARKQNPTILPIISRLPGFAFGPFRNVSPYRFYVNQPVKRIRFELIEENPEVLNFNHVGIWIRSESGALRKYKGEFVCSMSTAAEARPDPNAAMLGDGGNSVAVHSRRELKPWWEAEFPEPVNIVCVEFFNRKDIWGKRSRSLMFTAFDESNKAVSRHSRVTRKGVNAAFKQFGKPQLDSALAYARTKGQGKLASEVEALLDHRLHASEVEDDNKDNLVNALQQLNQAIAIPTPDMSGERETALSLSVPASARHLRVVAFAKRSMRHFTLNMAVEGETHSLSGRVSSEVPEDIFRLRDSIWCLQPPHIFVQSLPETSEPKSVKLWHGGHYSGTAFVQRVVQYSEDGEHWYHLEGTLDNLAARLALITAQEWVLGQAWTPAFASQLGHFCASYRVSQARTTKPLFRKQRPLMPHFFEGIEAGARSATYLPAVTYTRHGLTVPFRELDSEFLAERTKAFCDFIEKTFGLKTFPCYGTLLGMYRDGDFLPHDDDIDVAVIVEPDKGKTCRQSTEAWVEKLKAAGVECRLPTPSSLNVHCYFEDFDMDLFFIYRLPKKPGKMWTHMEGYQTRHVKASLLEPLKSFEFKGHTFHAPAKIEGFLKDRYGNGWVTPDPNFEL